jgi:hypothetical protein
MDSNSLTGVTEAISAIKNIDEIFKDKQKTAMIAADAIRDKARENYLVIDPDAELEEFTSHGNEEGAEVDIWEEQAEEIEFGTSKMYARPFLRPAIEEIANSTKLMDGLQSRIERASQS